MATRIFLSNKDTWGNDIETAINEAKEAFAADESYCGTWTCGGVRAIHVCDKAYFKRVGSEPRGFFARGRIVAANKEYQLRLINKNYEKLSEAYDVEVYNGQLMITYEWDSVVDYDKPLENSWLKNKREFSGAFFDFRASGGSFKEEYVELLDYYWEEHVSKMTNLGYGARRTDDYQDVLEFIQALDAEPEEELTDAQELADTDGTFNPVNIEDARKRAERSIVLRRGQSEFRRSLLEAYKGQCAITGCDAKQALESAHIIPYRGDDTNHPSNGLLLRADIHTLFDLHLITVDPETMKVLVAPSLRSTYYGKFDGRKLPEAVASLLSPEALKQHRNQCGW